MSSTRSGAKLFIAFTLLGGAVVVAGSFRRDQEPGERVEPLPESQVVLRESPAPGDVQIVRPDAPTAEIRPTLLAPPTQSSLEEQRWNEEVARVAPPPMMARAYPGERLQEDHDSGQATGIPTASGRRAKQRTHQVRDGDSLEALAQRYLGDSERWREIFQVNRQFVAQPDLLPLGAKLDIPAKYPIPPKPPAEPPARRFAKTPLVPVTP
jgi:nucleoid-associated protein YgaU